MSKAKPMAAMTTISHCVRVSPRAGPSAGGRVGEADTQDSGGVGRPVKAARAGPCDRPALSIYTGRRNVLLRAAPPRVGAGDRPRQPAVLQVLDALDAVVPLQR